MPSPRASWAAKKRQWLLSALGPVCVKCGGTQCLTFDCRVPTGDEHHKLNPANRMTFYVREACRGNLQVLCSDCNSRKGAKLEPKYTPVSVK